MRLQVYPVADVDGGHGGVRAPRQVLGAGVERSGAAGRAARLLRGGRRPEGARGATRASGPRRVEAGGRQADQLPLLLVVNYFFQALL